MNFDDDNRIKEEIENLVDNLEEKVDKVVSSDDIVSVEEIFLDRKVVKEGDDFDVF